MSPLLVPTFDGIKPETVGPVYDIGIGYLDPARAPDPLVTMVGYVLTPTGSSEEAADTTDEEHLVQIASPNSSDRFARFPQVSQGDWSRGERQRVFVDPAGYYLSDGFMDVSTPGNLTLIPGIRTDTLALTGTYNVCPIASDGNEAFAGVKTAGGNIAQFGGGAPVFGTVAGGDEIIDMLYSPRALVILTATGLWEVSFANPIFTAGQIVADAIANPEIPVKALAYLNERIYYINDDFNDPGVSKIKIFNYSDNSVVDGITAVQAEQYFGAICSSASGIVYSTFGNISFEHFIYTWSGSVGDLATRVAEIPGRVQYMLEALGVVYILVREFQVGYETKPAWSLYALVGNQMKLIDKADQILDKNFAPTCRTVRTFEAPTEFSFDFRPQLYTDGRYLYVAWPGLQTRRIDLLASGLASIGRNNTNNRDDVRCHRFVTESEGFAIDLVAYGNTAVVDQFSRASTAGSLESSFYDFGSPGTGKILRSVEYQTVAPLVGAQAVAFAYRTDQNAGFTDLDSVQVGPRNFVAVFPAGVKATEVQVRTTITADPEAGPPAVSSYTVIPDLGRVINITVACRRNQLSRGVAGPVTTQKYTGQQLLANINNIRNVAGGRCYLWWPDATIADTAVAQIQARLIDYKKVTVSGGAVGLRDLDGEQDMEGDVQLTFVESFDIA